tara:strand:- start:4596 stop:6554 length:1959 start_codon:yes stop_codon:yes gene_type:complete
MAILSSLFGAQQQQPAVGAQPIAGSEIPVELKPYYTDILSKAQALYDKRTEEGFVPYEGPTIAQFTPEQEQAFTGIAGLQGQVAPKFAEAERITKEAIAPITGEQIQEAMSPYQQAVVDIEKREAQKAFEQNVLPQVRAAQVASGSFGGTRGTLLESQSLADQARLLSDIQTRGSQAAFQDARAALDAQRTREGQGATQLANIAPQALRTGLAELGAQQSVGESRQQQTQTALDEAYRQFLQEREQPYTNMQKYQAVVTGAPLTTTQFASPPPPTPSLGQQLIGGLAGIGSLYGTFTGKPVFGQQAKTGGGIAGLVKRRLPGTVGTPLNYQPIGLPSIENLAQDEYTPINLAALEKAGLLATRQAAEARQKGLRQMGDLTETQIAALQKGVSNPAFTREQNLYNAILGAAFDEDVTEAGSGVGKILTGIGKTAKSYKKSEDEARAKRAKTATDINQLRMNLIDAQSKGDMEAVKAITDQINAMGKTQAARLTAQKGTSFERKGGLSNKEITDTIGGLANLEAVIDSAGNFRFTGENQPIANAGLGIFNSARTHFNKTDEPFEFTFTDPNLNQSVTVTLTKEDVGLTAGENLNTLSQQRETGKIRIVENQILTRIFSKFKDSGLIKDKKKTKEVNPNDEERGDGDPNAQYRTS